MRKEFDRFLHECVFINGCMYRGSKRLSSKDSTTDSNSLSNVSGKKRHVKIFSFRKKNYSAKKISYIWSKGKVPERPLANTCKNRWCILPAHIIEKSDNEKEKEAIKPVEAREESSDHANKRFTREEVFEILDYTENNKDKRGAASDFCKEESVNNSRVSRLLNQKTYKNFVGEYYSSTIQDESATQHFIQPAPKKLKISTRLRD